VSGGDRVASDAIRIPIAPAQVHRGHAEVGEASSVGRHPSHVAWLSRMHERDIPMSSPDGLQDAQTTMTQEQPTDRVRPGFLGRLDDCVRGGDRVSVIEVERQGKGVPHRAVQGVQGRSFEHFELCRLGLTDHDPSAGDDLDRIVHQDRDPVAGQVDITLQTGRAELDRETERRQRVLRCERRGATMREQDGRSVT